MDQAIHQRKFGFSHVLDQVGHARQEKFRLNWTSQRIMPDAYILGIESSCDETGASIVRSGEQILSNVVFSQIATHLPYGGVVPELASREHLKAIVPVVRKALADARRTYASVDAIAVTQGPGLAGALLVGLSYAKALAFALEKPLIAVNHLEGHIHAVLLEERQKGNHELNFPVLALVVSGGHTHLYLAEQNGTGWSYENIGHTRDDAAGEAFDKVAKLLGLGYPGGPLIDKLAREGDPAAIRFPRATVKRGRFDFSFSGFKTALRQYLAEHPASPATLPDVAASLQEALVDMLVETTTDALVTTGVERLVVSGGVAANRRLRARMTEAGAAIGVDVYFPPAALCTDNAAMIALAGAPRLAG